MGEAVSLFSGVGGLDLAIEAHGFKVAAQMENDSYCQAVLAKHWPMVPRYGDVKEVDWHAYRTAHGTPDLVAAGFPCQPVSQAGRRKAQADPRWLWPEVARCVRLLRPRYVFLENTLGLLSRGFGDVLGDLAALGFDAVWDCFQAADVGAPHQRDRVFVLAYAQRGGRDGLYERLQPGRLATDAGECGGVGRGGPADELDGRGMAYPTPLADPERGELQRRGEPGDLAGPPGAGVGEGPQRQRLRDAAGGGGTDVADADDGEPHQRQGEVPAADERCTAADERCTAGRAELRARGRGAADCSTAVADPKGGGRPWTGIPWAGQSARGWPFPVGGSEAVGHPNGAGHARPAESEPPGPGEGRAQPGVGGGADGLPGGMDGHRWPAPPGPQQYPWEPPRTVGRGVPDRGRRVKALGNAVVPAQGALAFAVLWQRMLEAS